MTYLQDAAMSADRTRALIAEIIATSLLVGIGLGSVHVAVATGALSLPAIAACWGGAVVLLILVCAPASGAHANPAVTIALACLGRFPWHRVTPYIIAQVLGALAAAALLHLLFADVHTHQAIVTGRPLTDLIAAANTEHYPHPGLLAGIDLPWWKAALAEAGGTGLILAAIVASTRPGVPSLAVPPAVGLSVALAIAIFAPVSQAGFNPARDLAPRLVAWSVGAVPAFSCCWFAVYVVAPVVGAIASGFLVTYLTPKAEVPAPVG